MIFINKRSTEETHLYYVFVYPTIDEDSMLYKVGSVNQLKKELRSQQRKYDVVKLW